MKRTQALKRAQSGRSSCMEAEANGEQQWKRMPRSGPRAAAEADASGEQQLKRTQSGRSIDNILRYGRSSSSESCPAPYYAR